MRDDGDGRDARELGGQEQLRAVGDEPLDKAGEGVEDAGRLARVELVALGDLSGDLARGEDSYGIVGRTEVGHGDEGGDGELSPALAIDATRELGEQVVDTAVVADQLQHPPRQQGDDDELAHAAYPLA